MAVINLINVSSIIPTTVVGAITTSRAAAIAAVATNKCAKVNTLLISNIDGVNAADVTVEVSVDNGSNYVAIANTVSVPADSTLVVVGKDNGFYLDETDLLAVTASAASDLTYLCSFELMDDA